MSQAGFYGKVAMLGDFVSRDLSHPLQQAWDQWLAAGLASSQQQLGQGWLQQYLVSPLWRFVLAPQLLSEQAWMGVMMPSVDRVGRYFPLTILSPLSPGMSLQALLRGQQNWFFEAEQALLATLQEGAELATFAQAVAALPALEFVPSELHRQLGAGVLQSHANSPEGMLAALAELALEGSSVWWGQGSAQVPAGMLHCRGLPCANDFAALFLGANQAQMPTVSLPAC